MAVPREAAAAFAYTEPQIVTVLNQAGFLLALNLVNACLDKFLYCGLVGQLLIGILWGTPGAKWLDQETETVIQQLGYLGLIMLVYEGGLSTSVKLLRRNLLVSVAVAVTGIGVPIGLSFALKKLGTTSSLQVFAAGMALSATSLGTTFTILSTTQLLATRLGTVTTSAAMLDDVVGLIMIQVISNLGENENSFKIVTVIRPIFVSIGFAIGIYLLWKFVLKTGLNRYLLSKNKVPEFLRTMPCAFIVQTAVLVGIVSAATYAGTSTFFAAYIAGIITSSFDELVGESKESVIKASGAARSTTGAVHNQARSPIEGNVHQQSASIYGEGSSSTCPPERQTSPSEVHTGEIVYKTYYKQPVNRILVPMFFASIGFAIPIAKMFQGSIVWRGLVYAIMMIFGKAVTGLWLVRFSQSQPLGAAGLKSIFYFIPFSTTQSSKNKKGDKPLPSGTQSSEIRQQGDTNTGTNDENAKASISNTDTHPASRIVSRPVVSIPTKPRSLYPPSILGLAMVARGEIGYLIASLAEGQGIFSAGPSGEASEIYLIVIWAISICTLVGPICVGIIVKRVRKLQRLREVSGGTDPLGAWGI
ncbi:Sodium/hydrogen exchanger family-domain-containing protein [Talaromyces proteolyticus]|uniref:Sodium/hydrogen exchanger family-domain-containing protein n=1 Tax=Talaromyces proteolyticus TaxID=1131652 RepID=A0AAD4Q1X3_9EURO|nr:Sodium/hydrogen exchanger family-domain-containing protein [Talaromyces proteolyticus]KAH8703067.1 Sodium/hydrogen exchanger family-domain-containing protein [Talaromyces proteolyticus]